MKTKKEIRFFTIFQYEKEQEYLREQHKQGWKFVKVNGLSMYHFEECQPEDVIYQLDYNQEGSAHKEEYIKMFADCGWDYIQEYVGYSYFRKSAKDMVEDESIFCDDSSHLAMMDRVFKGRMIPLLILFCACLLPQFVSNLINGHIFLAVVMGSISLIYISIFVDCAIRYHRFKKRMD